MEPTWIPGLGQELSRTQKIKFVIGEAVLQIIPWINVREKGKGQLGGRRTEEAEEDAMGRAGN